MKTRLMATLLAIALLVVPLSGCGGAASTVEMAASEEVVSQQVSVEAPEAEPETVENPEPGEESVTEEAASVSISYPLDGDDNTLSLFTSFPGNLTSYMSTFGDHPGFQAAETATGVKIQFTEVSMENAATQFDLMVASDSFTDLVCGFGDMYVGGLSAAYEGELIYDVTEFLETCAPDYLGVVNARESNHDIVYEMDGTMLGVYGLYLYDYSAVTNGVLIRQDWLDDLQLDTPVTYDDWYHTLTAFKNEKGATAALLLPNGTQSSGGTYVGGYQTAGYSTEARQSGAHFFQVDGKVTSSLIDENYRDYLTLMNQWYTEGLIYPDFYSNETRSIMDGLIYDNQTGIFDGKVDFITRYESGDATGTIRLTGIANPLKEAGDTFGFGNYVSAKSHVSITTSCQNPELAMMWLNWFFTEDGILASNYGQEGVTYNLDQDGTPVFTDLILHNEDPEMAYGNVTRLYITDEVIPTLYDQTRELAAYSQAEQEAIDTWTNSKEAVYTMPSVTLSTEANEEFAAKLVDIETYASECIVKFIIGDMPLSQWDDFTATIRELGIERCIEIYQEALDAQNAA